ncbi:2005_t:CDS:1, partial [Scutellospora calospora]
IFYYCNQCHKKFKCKKTESKKDKSDHKDYYKKFGVPLYELCNACHWRCKNKKYTNCCNLNKYNDIICEYCKNNNIICERSLSKSQVVFDKIKDKISFISWQYESNE